MIEVLPEWCEKETVIFCSGNILLGDDGFGPAVAESLLENLTIPESACVLNVGTAIGDFLFDILASGSRPKRLVVVDTMDRGLAPGELTRLNVEGLPGGRGSCTLAGHQAPTTDLLREIASAIGAEVTVLCCEPTQMQDEVAMGLSEPVRDAVERAAKMIAQSCFMG